MAASAFLACPPGFDAAELALNALADADAAAFEAASDAALGSSGAAPDDRALRNATEGLRFVYRTCKAHPVDAAELPGVLTATTGLTEAAAALVAARWAREAASRPAEPADGAAAAAELFRVGKLVSLEWKIGVAAASSLCATLLEPYALLIFRTADTDGRQTRRAVELTLPELQQLTATFEEVSAVLERV